MMFFPGKRYLAKPNPASTEKTVCPTAMQPASARLRKNRRKYRGFPRKTE